LIINFVEEGFAGFLKFKKNCFYEICRGISKVFTMGPTFRSENSRSRRHLAEFRMLEAEIAFCNDLQPILSTIESLVKHSAKIILEHGALDLITVGNYYNENLEVCL
jgi:asparaginyl-tRNA synthetase